MKIFFDEEGFDKQVNEICKILNIKEENKEVSCYDCVFFHQYKPGEITFVGKFPDPTCQMGHGLGLPTRAPICRDFRLSPLSPKWSIKNI